MRQETWDRAKDLFEELSEQPREQWEKRLAEVCAGDGELRASVLKLLGAHARAGDEFLRQPIVDIPDIPDFPETPGGTPIAAADIGQWIGRYQLEERLGSGGFGAVYAARQVEPMRRDVALKVLHPGMQSRDVISRFEAERQALALMDHPSIARVLDAGETADHRPFFVMELVRGTAITTFCRENHLSIRDRVELMIRVCQGVHHAHQKGVIHRDLKPGNILVTQQDGLRTPKIIDFGIAKAIDAGMSDLTLAGGPQLVGTPAYMSPEQAEVGKKDVDTRSDLYSLGVVLYELLAGGPPFESGDGNRSGFADLLRLIRESDPPLPSIRAGRAAPGDASALRGDLDWIVMKCLEKDRDRRYDSAAELAADLERHLRNEPVLAGPPTVTYRIGKFARRNRAAVAGGAIVLLALCGGVVLATWGMFEARHSRHVAEQHEADARRAAARSDAVSRFLQDTLSAADPRESGTRDLTMREALSRSVNEIDGGKLKGEPDVEAAVRMVIARSYRGLALYDLAEPQIEAAVGGFAKNHGIDSLLYADALQERATLRKERGLNKEAEIDFRASLAINRRHRPPHDRVMVGILGDTAACLSDMQTLDEAEVLLREALAIALRPEFESQPARAETQNNLAFVVARQGKLDEAERLFRSAIDVNRRVLGEQHPNLATNLDNLGQLMVALNRTDDAGKAYDEALAIRRKVYGDTHPDVAISLHNYATLLDRTKRLDEARKVLEESLSILKRLRGWESVETLTVMHSLVSICAKQPDLPRAESLMTEAFEAVKDSPRIEPEQKRNLAGRMSQLLAALKRSEESERYQKIAESYAASQPAGSQPTPK